MPNLPVQFLPKAQANQLTELAERARISLSRFSETEVGYNAIGIQLLDEWIDRHLRQMQTPSSEIITVWAAFLGETFRRRFNGEWAVDASKRKPELGVLCPRDEEGLLFVEIMGQIELRIVNGMGESLALYYTMKGMEIKGGIE